MPADTATSARWAQIRKACLERPGAQHDRKWGNVDTFLVLRKMFFVIILDERDRPLECWLKAGPERFLELTDQPGFRPAPYMARNHWVATRTPQTLPLSRWQELIAHSYRLTTARLPLYRQRELGVLPAMDHKPAF